MSKLLGALNGLTVLHGGDDAAVRARVVAVAALRKKTRSSAVVGKTRGKRRRQRPRSLPRVRPPRRARPRLLPQGGKGDDTLTATGAFVELDVCPASSLPPRLTSFSSAGRRRRRLVHGLRPHPHREQLRVSHPARLTKLEFNQHYNSPRRRRSRSVTWCL